MRPILCLPMLAGIIAVGCSSSSTPTVVRPKPSEGQPITLRLQPKVGTTFEYETTTEQIQSTNSSPQATKATSVSSMKVLKSGAEGVQIQSTVKDVQGGDPAAAEQSKGMAMTLTYDAEYKLQKVEVAGGDAMAKEIAKGIEATMKLTPSFPARALKVGDTWTIPIDLGELFSAMSQGQLKVKGDAKMSLVMKLERLTQEAGREAAVLSLAAQKPLTLEGGGQELKVSWDQTGEMTVDLETGMTISSYGTQKQKMEGGGQSMESTIKTTMKLKGPFPK